MMIAVVVLGTVSARAAGPDSLWMRSQGDTTGMSCQSITETSDGGFVLTGHIWMRNPFSGDHSDMLVARLNADGDTLWMRHFGGLDYDEGKSIIETSDGSYVAAAPLELTAVT